MLERSREKLNEDVRIIFLGHIGIEKGIMDLIEAVRIINNKGIDGFEVCIYGEELSHGELDHARDIVKDLGIDKVIHFYEACV
jgi:glycosyltransferase involved in cell wall biosynthesis